MNETASAKAPRDRSAAYPSVSLPEAIELSKKVVETYPKSQFDRESAAKALGYEKVTGTSAPKIAALVHFGLIERTGSSYKNSQLAERILHFVTEEERKEAIVEAVKNPKLFDALISEYAGRAVPPTLNSVLVRQHGISSKVSDRVVEIFKDSVEFAGLCKNGVFQGKGEIDSGTREPLSSLENDNHQERLDEKPKTAKILGLREEVFSIVLPSGAAISYPMNIAFHLQTTEKYQSALKSLEEAMEEATKEAQKKEAQKEVSDQS